MARIFYTLIGLLVLVGLGIAAASYSRTLRPKELSTTDEYRTPAGYKTYTNTQYGFAFDYLAGDRLDESFFESVWYVTVVPADAGEWRPLGFGESADWVTRGARVRVYETLDDWEQEKKQNTEYQEGWAAGSGGVGADGMRGKTAIVSNNGIEWQVFYLVNEESGQSIDVWMGVLKSGYGISVESESDVQDEPVPQETLRSVRNI